MIEKREDGVRRHTDEELIARFQLGTVVGGHIRALAAELAATQAKLAELRTALRGSDETEWTDDEYVEAAREADGNALEVGRLSGLLARSTVRIRELEALNAERNRQNALAFGGRDRLREALRTYGHHTPECDYMQDELPCTCGFRDAIKEPS